MTKVFRQCPPKARRPPGHPVGDCGPSVRCSAKGEASELSPRDGSSKGPERGRAGVLVSKETSQSWKSTATPEMQVPRPVCLFGWRGDVAPKGRSGWRLPKTLGARGAQNPEAMESVPSAGLRGR